MNALLTIVLNVHKEAHWAHRAARSAIVSAKRLIRERPTENVRIVIVADKSDEQTRACIVSAMNTEDWIDYEFELTEHGDLGLARNSGVLRAEGRFVVFLDGDDIFGEDWCLRGVEALEAAIVAGMPEDRVAAHSQMNVDFGDGSFWWSQPDQRSDEFDPTTFWTTNCWSSGAMASRATLIAHPYKPRGLGLGFEDWEWNARTVAAGVLHVSAKGAVNFIRKKSDGMNADSARKRQLVTHSDYFSSPPDQMPRHKAIKDTIPDATGDWLVRQWRAAHLIEPALWPDARAMQSLPRYKAEPHKGVPRLCASLFRTIPYDPTHIILAPCLVRGGADKRIIAYAEAAARAGGKPVVILTDREGDGSWKDSIPSGVHVVDAAAIFDKAGHDAGSFSLARAIMRWASGGSKPILHLVNSRIGYQTVARYGNALRESGVRSIVCSLYGSEQSKGRLGGAAFNGWFESARDHINTVISDNENHLAEIDKILSWPASKTMVAPSIVKSFNKDEIASLNYVRQSVRKPAATRVLWASRMVKGKRPDRLLAIAECAHEKKIPLLFAVAGQPIDDFSRRIAAKLAKLPNVKISPKPFDGWAGLAPERMDVFLFTSEAEGMPNVVLEALAHGLRVVSSPVGDVPLLPGGAVSVIQEEDLENPDAWIEALIENPSVTDVAHGSDYVRTNHSTESFDSALRSAGYFDGIAVKEKDDGPRSDGGTDKGRVRRDVTNGVARDLAPADHGYPRG